MKQPFSLEQEIRNMLLLADKSNHENNVRENAKREVLLSIVKKMDENKDNTPSLMALKTLKSVFDKSLESIIVNGYETTAISYWGYFHLKSLVMTEDFIEPSNWEKDKYYPSMRTYHALKQGGSIQIKDTEDSEDDSNWILTYDNMFMAFLKMIDSNPLSFSNYLNDSSSASDDDVLIQMALFNGEVIYG